MDLTVGSVRRMTPADIAAVAELEGLSFDLPWPPEVFFEELASATRTYFVSEWEGRITAYGGIMLVAGEAHVMTIAVTPDHRRRGEGTRMLLTLVDAAVERGASALTLEVAVSNVGAIALYRRFGFEEAGRRHEYYGREDALVMTVADAIGADYRALLDGIREGL